MNETIRTAAPAKLNLRLRVLGKREDGFHEIETLMVPFDLADEIAVRRGLAGAGLAFRCSDPDLPGDDTNLAVRAARAFCSEAGIAPDFEIALEKRIPHGAGLGGGSSDAAATLRALDRLCGGVLPEDALARLAAGIGSDVPFFLAGGAAVARGRGERVEPVAFPHRFAVLVAKPPFGVPTPWAYGAWRDAAPIPGVRYDPQPMPWGELANDLERPVFQKYLLLPAIKGWLLDRPEVAGALMTGSGAAMFAVLREGADAGGLAGALRGEFGPALWTWTGLVDGTSAAA